MSLAPGTRLGVYEIVSRIGAGGMGEVYRARDSRLDRDVAVKVLSDAVVQDPGALARFEREAKSVAALSHPNILAIHDVGSVGGVSFAVMELLEGESLADTVAHAKLPWRKAASVAIEIAEGLFAAHSKGIVHRDLKPANVFVTSDGRVKILDFGIARVGSLPSAGGTSVATVAETSAGTVLGTVGYMSPEQVRGTPADARSDVFSLGCVLYEMVTGRRAFARDTAAETLTAILREDPEPVSATEGAVPLELDRIVAHCLEKNPAERFQSARDVAFNLRAALSSSGATQGSGTAPRPVRRTGVWVGAGVALLVLLVGGLVLLQRRGARPGAPGDAATAAPPRIASVAVLPLQNLSGDPEQEYFADGMTEALIADLAKIQALRVISRTSVMQYKGVKKALPEIAKELGVDGIVEGSVQRAGDRVRITAQLIEAATDKHLWAQSYERDSRDVFALQSDVAQAIAREIRVTVSPEEKTRLASSRPVNPAAHEAYLKARHWQLKFNEEGFRKASEFYDRAVALDPGYALAWAGIAENLSNNGADLHMPASEAYAKARPAAEKALQLDESLAEAHTSLGLIKAYFDWDWRGAEADLVRAIELNPGSAWARDWYGWFLATLGRFDESISQLERARALDPLSPGMSGDLGLAHLLKGDYARATVELDRALALDPAYWVPRLARTWMYQRKGDFAAAVREAEALDPRDAGPVALAGLARAYALAGRTSDARRVLRELEKLSRTGFVSPFFFAEVHAALGEKDVAFEWIRKCQRERSNGLALWAKVGPPLDPLRSDPRFAELLRDLNLAP